MPEMMPNGMPPMMDIPMQGYGVPEMPMMGQMEEDAPEKKKPKLLKWLDEGNIVSRLEDHKEKTPATIYEDITQSYGDADASMEKWKKKYTAALKLAKMQPTAGGEDIDTKDFPFPGASVAMMPFVMEAMLDFASRAAPDLVWTEQYVSGQVQGMDRDESKLARAIRVESYLNYQLINTIPGWRRGQDKNVFALPCVGTTYKKTYFDYEGKQVCSDFLMADKVVFNQKYSTFEEAPDKFEPITYTRNEVIGFIRGDQQWDIAEDKELEKDKDEFEFVIAHTWIDLDGDGLKEPYCAICFDDVNRIVCLYPDYDEDTVFFNDKDQIIKIKAVESYTQYMFLPDPEGGPMGLGWGIILGPMYTAINTLVRDNLDAGTLSLTAANSGLIAQSIGEGRGNRQLSSRVDVKLGTLTPYPMGALNGSLRDNVVQFPFAGASPVLMQLTEWMTAAAQKMTVAAYNVEANQGEAASLYLARLQQGLKTPNMIVMRVYECAKQEFKKIAALDYKHYDNVAYNQFLDEPQPWDMEADFDPDECQIELVADPSQGSDVERMAKAQAVYNTAKEQLALPMPQTIINFTEATKRLFKAMQVPDDDIEKLVPPPNPEPPLAQKLAIGKQQFEAELLNKEQIRKEKATNADVLHKQMQVQVGQAEVSLKYAQARKYMAESQAALSPTDPRHHEKAMELQAHFDNLINEANESAARVKKIQAEIELINAKTAHEEAKPALAIAAATLKADTGKDPG